MDPAEELDFAMNLVTMLDAGETVSSFTVTLPAESTLLGLQLGTATKAPAIAANKITIWLTINSANRNDAIFAGIVSMPIEVTIVTSAGRTKQRTAGIKVTQK